MRSLVGAYRPISGVLVAPQLAQAIARADAQPDAQPKSAAPEAPAPKPPPKPDIWEKLKALCDAALKFLDALKDLLSVFKKAPAGGAKAMEAPATSARAPAIGYVDPRLARAVQMLGSDPEGAQLLSAAKAAGLHTIQVGTLPRYIMGETLDGTITISLTAMLSLPDLIHTLGHELGHAATPGDGDSIEEEKTVDALGQRIQRRLAPGSTYRLNVSSYSDLFWDNGIHGDLRRLGISA